MYCYHCMCELPEGSGFCSSCGNSTKVGSVPPHRLLPGTVLHDRYLIGHTIGEGGFGITYIGCDQHIGIKIAVKEFFPHGFANRNNTVSADVSLNYQNEADYYTHAREQFLREAKNLAKFSEESSIVNVRDYFSENNTAYIVMEFVEGMTLTDLINRNGTFEARDIFSLMIPVMRALKTMHSAAVIHRDVSPDNIMMTDSGKLKLMDFGSARYYAGDEKKTMSVILKPGYAPFEQYSCDGNQGPWTDIYAVCATIYKCITGKTPVDAMSRYQQDKLIPPSALGIGIPAGLEHILMRGMSVFPQDRYHSMDELMIASVNALSGKDSDLYLTNNGDDFRTTYANDDLPPENPERTYGDSRMYDSYDYPANYPEPQKKSKGPIIAVIAVIVALLIAGGVVAFFLLKDNGNKDVTEATAKPTTQTQPATLAPETEAPEPTQSTTVKVPNVTNKKYSDAKSELEKLGLQVETQYENSDTVAKDYIIRQSIDEGRTLNKGDTILLTVSSGKAPTQPPEPTKSPAPTKAPAPTDPPVPEFSSYLVSVPASTPVYDDPSKSAGIAMTIDEDGVYTIVDEITADGVTWGHLKSGAGWLNIDEVLASGGSIVE